MSAPGSENRSEARIGATVGARPEHTRAPGSENRSEARIGFLASRLPVAGLSVLLVAGCAWGDSTSGAASHEVRVGATGFEPAVLTVRAGDEVRWHNLDGRLHSVVPAEVSAPVPTDDGSTREDTLLFSGSTLRAVFEEPGIYLYVSDQYPEEQIVSVIRVEQP